MRAFLGYLWAYARRISIPIFLLTTLLLAILVAVNYTFGIERRILALGRWYVVYGGFVAFYGLVISLSWGLQYEWPATGRLNGAPGAGATLADARATMPPLNTGLLRLLALATLFFAAKMVHWDLSAILPGSRDSVLNRYWTVVTQLPAKFLLLAALLWMCRRAGWLEDIGMTTKGFLASPYLLLLLLLVPLVALASTQPDFLHVYPKVKTIAFMSDYSGPVWPWKAGYELSYGIDFLSIELFFRGLLVIGVVRYAGERAILPMAAFYCTIHFGKPIFECISSFFGGLVLGVLAYRTRSILGGLIVHLGLAWMMEIGGWVGRMMYIY